MDLTLSDFTAQLSSAQPAPGGGGAAALTGALAASLTAMAANVTAANPRYAERSDALRSLIDACETQRTTLLALIEADAAGFLPLQKAYAIPRTDADRAAKLAAAAQTACLAPLAFSCLCGTVCQRNRLCTAKRWCQFFAQNLRICLMIFSCKHYNFLHFSI